MRLWGERIAGHLTCPAAGNRVQNRIEPDGISPQGPGPVTAIGQCPGIRRRTSSRIRREGDAEVAAVTCR
ncbi:MAG: hypothetical protein JW810_13390 [Sedimentisphaerales bacterium]|nr:hypothetical protein [Sedimentisphaerales bacterium]